MYQHASCDRVGRIKIQTIPMKKKDRRLKTCEIDEGQRMRLDNSGTQQEIPSHGCVRAWVHGGGGLDWTCLLVDPCENACPSAYACISLPYTFNYKTGSVLPLVRAHSHTHTPSFPPVMQITAAPKMVWVRIKCELNEAWLYSLYSLRVRKSPVTMGDPHAVATPVRGLTRQEVT